MFFNELGHPWEIHICKKYFLAQQIQLIKGSDRLSDEEIYAIITKIEKQHGRTLTRETEEMLDSILGKRKRPLMKSDIYPTVNSDFSGRVMEVNNPINIFKRLGYDPSNVFSVKLLGKLNDSKWLEIKVRSHPNERNECFEYAILITENYFKTNLIRQADFIVGIIDVVTHPRGSFWKLNTHRRM